MSQKGHLKIQTKNPCFDLHVVTLTAAAAIPSQKEVIKFLSMEAKVKVSNMQSFKLKT